MYFFTLKICFELDLLIFVVFPSYIKTQLYLAHIWVICYVPKIYFFCLVRSPIHMKRL